MRLGCRAVKGKTYDRPRGVIASLIPVSQTGRRSCNNYMAKAAEQVCRSRTQARPCRGLARRQGLIAWISPACVLAMLQNTILPLHIPHLWILIWPGASRIAVRNVATGLVGLLMEIAE